MPSTDALRPHVFQLMFPASHCGIFSFQNRRNWVALFALLYSGCQQFVRGARRQTRESAPAPAGRRKNLHFSQQLRSTESPGHLKSVRILLKKTFAYARRMFTFHQRPDLCYDPVKMEIQRRPTQGGGGAWRNNFSHFASKLEVASG